MSKCKKWASRAVILLVAGVIVFGVSAFAMGFDFSRLNTVKYETVEYAIGDAFQRIDIHAEDEGVALVSSEDGDCRVIFHDREGMERLAEVRDGALVISSSDPRHWYEKFDISFYESPLITLLLPQSAYESLVISADTGNVEIPAVFSFGSIRVDSHTSDVKCFASVTGELSITLTTGDITVSGLSAESVSLSVTTGHIQAESIQCQGDFTAGVTTGSVYLNGLQCANLSSVGKTGSITLKNVLAENGIHVERSTGGVQFDACDAASIYVQTSTGSVWGTLRTGKAFSADSHTGSVNTPASSDGGPCEIHTSTGSITIEVLSSDADAGI